MKNKILLVLIFALVGSTVFSKERETINDDANLVSGWLRVQHKLILATKGVPHVAYSRHFAYTSIAVYEAMVSGDPRYRSLRGQLPGLDNLPGCIYRC
jgi:hypothetical protein